MAADNGISEDTDPRPLSRRDLLRRASALGVAVPVLWRVAPAAHAAAADPTGSLPPGPQWIAFGANPKHEMHISWATGTSNGSAAKPVSPVVRWGRHSSYGQSTTAQHCSRVPLPAGVSGEPAENTYYSSALVTGLEPDSTYHYSVSNDGQTWSPDATFRTAPKGVTDFRFTAFGDQAAGADTAAPMVSLAASRGPAFHLSPGDLAYATPSGMLPPHVSGFYPDHWDAYLAMIGPRAAQSIPWHASVGAHEVEPLGQHGYAGFVTRFRQSYANGAGSPVVHSFKYGNVAVIHLDGNDLSAQETVNTGYTNGAQTHWLRHRLHELRKPHSDVDFIVVVCNCCCYSTNQKHGSDGGLRDVWGPLFDEYAVDLVISGHVHAYERTHPIRAGQPTRKARSGATVHPQDDGTTYVCVGTGGNSLYRTWFGTSDGGDAGSSTAPKVWRWSGGDTARGGHGTPQDVPDPAKHFSAYRQAAYACLQVTVKAPTKHDPHTRMHLHALRPEQSAGQVTSISSPDVMDSVTLVRHSRSA